MPTIRVDAGDVLRGREGPFMAAMNQAVIATLGVRSADNDVRLHLYGDGTRIVPEGRDPHRYCIVEIRMLAGRPKELKKELRSELARYAAPFGIAFDDIKMILFDVPRENLGLG